MKFDPNTMDWRLYPVNARITKGELTAMIGDMPASYQSGAPDFRAAKSELIEFVRAMRERIWDDMRPADRQELVGFVRAGTLCQIPASEVNAWLRGLPPVPMFTDSDF